MRAFISGTFDHLHAGHRHFLDAVFSQADFVYIGIVSDNYVQENRAWPEKIQPLDERKKALKTYLYSAGLLEKAKIEEIGDELGPATRAADLDAVFCTSRGKDSALSINDERMRVALRPLRIIEIPIYTAEDDQPLTSERVRNGEIDVKGMLVPKQREREEE